MKNYMEYIKAMGFLDLIVLAMLDMGYPAIEIAERMHIARSTVYEIKNKNKDLKAAFKE